jgi:hypothetical protein
MWKIPQGVRQNCRTDLGCSPACPGKTRKCLSSSEKVHIRFPLERIPRNPARAETAHAGLMPPYSGKNSLDLPQDKLIRQRMGIKSNRFFLSILT